MSPKTEKMMQEMIAHARAGHEIIPAFWQPLHGRSNTVSAAIRAARKRGLLIEAGEDGLGRPTYRAPIPAATHAAPAAIQ